jgi:addiction module HigA family antidote
MTVPKIPLPTNRRPNTPGEILVEEFLKPLAISQTKFAKHIGISYVRLNEIANGRRAVTPDTAMRFARALGMSDEFWLGLQQDVELWDAHHSPAAKAIAKIKPLSELAAAS